MAKKAAARNKLILGAVGAGMNPEKLSKECDTIQARLINPTPSVDRRKDGDTK